MQTHSSEAVGHLCGLDPGMGHEGLARGRQDRAPPEAWTRVGLGRGSMDLVTVPQSTSQILRLFSRLLSG